MSTDILEKLPSAQSQSIKPKVTEKKLSKQRSRSLGTSNLKKSKSKIIPIETKQENCLVSFEKPKAVAPKEI